MDNYFGTDNSLSFVCKLTFETAASGYSDKVIDFANKTSTQSSDKSIIKGGFKWSRTTNKNAIYVQLPVESLDEGGYGYDLGFLQDNFTIEYSTNDYGEYKRFISLAKTNTGEKVGVLTFGPSGSEETYNVILRYLNSNGDPGSDMITISCTLTVTTKIYAAGE